MMGSISLADVRASDTERDTLLGLVRAIRMDKRFNCPIVMIVECAPGTAASHVERLIREAEIPNVCVMSERKGYLEGVPKTERITWEYVVELSRALSSGYLVYSDAIVTYQPNAAAKNPRKTVLKLKKRLKAMMGNLRKVYRKSQEEHGDKRFFITAKINGAPDDMLVACAMAIYWRGVFLRDPEGKYAAWHERIRMHKDIVFPL